MAKEVIRLNEAKLIALIENTVKNILTEGNVVNNRPYSEYSGMEGDKKMYATNKDASDVLGMGWKGDMWRGDDSEDPSIYYELDGTGPFDRSHYEMNGIKQVMRRDNKKEMSQNNEMMSQRKNMRLQLLRLGIPKEVVSRLSNSTLRGIMKDCQQ